MNWRAAMVGLSLVLAGCRTATPAPTRQEPSVRLDDPRAAFARAYDLYRAGDGERALPVFRALEAEYPVLADYHLYFVGSISAQRGDFTAAVSAFETLLRDYPDSVKAPAAQLELGRVLLRMGRRPTPCA